MTKEQIQMEAVETMRNYRFLLLQWATGLGKSKAAIDIIKDMLVDYPNARILLVVAEIAHISNWRAEFEKWGVNPDICVITTYASLKHQRNNRFKLMILDEAHHAGSDLRLDILSDIHATKVLALSATMPQDVYWSLAMLYGNDSKILNYSLQDAIKAEILPEPSFYLVPMILDSTTPNQLLVEEWGTKSKRVTIKCEYKDVWTYRKNRSQYPNVRLEISCTEFQKYYEIDAKMEYWRKMFMRTRNEGIKNKWLQAGSERKRFLGNLKENKAREVLALIQDKRYICFCAGIEQAEKLGGRNSIHSKKDNSLGTIEDFNNKKINSLYAIGMLQEGQNLVDIEAAVIVQLDGQERSFIQKVGRAMRAENPVVFILYYQYTQDEKYLKNAIEDLDTSFIQTVTDLKELEL